jgi:hypothetical protein
MLDFELSAGRMLYFLALVEESTLLLSFSTFLISKPRLVDSFDKLTNI